ncbi:Hepatocyte growth factor receptor, partial [Geodia barretti]
MATYSPTGSDIRATKQEISQETCSVGLSEEFSEKPSFNLTQLIGDSFYCIQVSGRTGAGFGNISTIVVKLPVGPPPVDVIDPVEEPEVVPQPVVDPITGDDGISDTSARVSFSLPSEINSNGPVDRALIYVQRMPSSSQAIGTWYESSQLTQEWPQYAALSVNITPNSQGRKRQEGDIEVSFTIGNSMTCGPTDTVCNGPLNPSADYGVRYTLFSGDQLQEFPFFPGAQFTTGESGLVYRGYINYGSMKALVAIKTCKGSSDIKRLMKEVSAMFSFKHPNVMSLTGVCFDKGVPLVIMPFMRNGTVLEYVESASKVGLDICLQISKGMTYLAQQKFVHRD